MALRSAHGSSAGGHVLVVEVMPVDELPEGVPAPASAVPSGASTSPGAPPLRPKGAFGPVPAGTPEASALARHAAQARWAKVAQEESKLRALEALGLLSLDALPEGGFVDYLTAAERFAQAECERLAAFVGGGACTPNVISIVQSAALAMAASRHAYATGNAQQGLRASEISRQHLLAAHELCAREARTRPKETWAEAVARINSDD